MKTVLVLGGGFAGCVMAYFLKKKGFEVKLFEASSGLGGGCRTFFYHGHPYTFGPHHLLVPTTKMYLLDFFSEFLTMRRIHHYMMTHVESDGEFYSYPPHIDDIVGMPDYEQIQKELDTRNLTKKVDNFHDYWIASIGETLYNKYINNYSKKMWKIKNNKEIDSIGAITGIDSAVQTGSKERFIGKYEIFYPVQLDGYNSLFEKCTKDCEIFLNTKVAKFDLESKSVFLNNGEVFSGDIIINTISLDSVFDYCYGELRYIGRDFQKIILPTEQVLPDPYHFVHYPGDGEDFTRIVEYKKMTGYQSKHTLIGIETPSFNNKLYPYQTKVEVERHKKYNALTPKDCYHLGRMATYRYIDMATLVDDCMQLIKEL